MLERAPVQVKDYPLKINLFAHQKLMLDNVMRGSWPIFAEMGTGKTGVVIAYFSSSKEWQHSRSLIICPKIVMKNWQAEFLKFAGIPTIILDGTKQERIDTLNRHPTGIFIINYEGLLVLKDYFTKEVSKQIGQRTGNLRTIKLLESQFELNTCVVDESHRVKNYKSQRTQIALALSAKSKRRYALSGSPILGHLFDLYNQYHFVYGWGNPLGAGFTKYQAKYFYNAGFDWLPRTGAVDQINAIVAATSSRFKKEDCLDLPEKTFVRREVELSPEARKLYIAIKEQILEEVEDAGIKVSNVLTSIIKLMQIASGYVKKAEGDIVRFNCPKIAAVKEIMEEIEPTKKVVIWAHFVDNIERLRDELSGVLRPTDKNYNPAVLYGEVKDKEEQIRKFKNDESCRVFIGQQHSGGIGINLTESDYVIYFSQNYSLEDRVQSEDRTHRIGSEKHTNITYVSLVVPGSIDDKIEKALSQKIDLSSSVMDRRAIADLI